MKRLLPILACCAVVACGDDETESSTEPAPNNGKSATISVADHSDPITTAADENLFVITVNAISDTYPIGEFTVAAQAPGDASRQMYLDINDANSNGVVIKSKDLQNVIVIGYSHSTSKTHKVKIGKQTKTVHKNTHPDA